MRRRAAPAGMDPELPGARHDLRDRAGRAEQGNAGSRRAVSGAEIALASVAVARNGSDEAIHCSPGFMDCFAEPVVGRRFAPTRWLAMKISSDGQPRRLIQS